MLLCTVEVVIYPVLFRIGTFEVTSFGVFVALGALIGLWVFARELRRSGLPSGAVDAASAGVIGGMVGAKLLWVAAYPLPVDSYDTDVRNLPRVRADIADIPPLSRATIGT